MLDHNFRVLFEQIAALKFAADFAGSASFLAKAVCTIDGVVHKRNGLRLVKLQLLGGFSAQ